MNFFDWIDYRLARRREAKLGKSPMTDIEYQRNLVFLRRLQALDDQDYPPDRITRFQFRLKQGSWTVTGTRNEIERTLTRDLASFDARQTSYHAWVWDEHQRRHQRQQRIEQRRLRRMARRRVLGEVSIFLLKLVGVFLVVALCCCLIVVVPVLIGVPALLGETLLDIDRHS